jgi:hypothetical protein
MTINGKTNSGAIQTERARAGGNHAPVIAPVPLDSDDANWPCGLIMSQDTGGKAYPYGEATLKIGTGDAAEKTFEAILGAIEPGSLSVTDGVETFSDDGFGVLTGDAAGTGKINYQTGQVSVVFHAAPANAANVNATFTREPGLILDEETDTSATDSGLAVIHGPVRLDALKVGVTTPAAPSAALVRKLSKLGIHAV